ncbi:hypothetical protein [Microcystis phage Mel-JY01]
MKYIEQNPHSGKYQNESIKYIISKQDFEIRRFMVQPAEIAHSINDGSIRGHVPKNHPINNLIINFIFENMECNYSHKQQLIGYFDSLYRIENCKHICDIYIRLNYIGQIDLLLVIVPYVGFSPAAIIKLIPIHDNFLNALHSVILGK